MWLLILYFDLWPWLLLDVFLITRSTLWLILSGLEISRQNVVRSSHRIAFIFSIVPKKRLDFFSIQKKGMGKKKQLSLINYQFYYRKSIGHIQHSILLFAGETIQRRKVLKEGIYSAVNKIDNHILSDYR